MPTVAADVSRRILSEEKSAPTNVGGYFVNDPGSPSVPQHSTPDPLPTAKLTDFGIGQVTSEEVLAGMTRAGFSRPATMSSSPGSGTLMYMAPELLAGRTASIRCDIYSLGVVLFQLLAADFTKPVTSDWAKNVPDPLLREDLEKCFAGNPQERFAGAQELAQGLRTLADRRWVVAEHRAEAAARERAAYRKGVLRTAAGALAVVLVIAALALYALHKSRVAKRETASATRHAAEEAIQRQRAEAAATETKMTLAAADFSQAVRLIAESKGNDALAYLARSLSADPANGAAVTRLTTLLAFHSWMLPVASFQVSNAVSSAHFSPDGKRIVIAWEDRARVCDAQSGQPVTEVLKHESKLRAVQFSPDGTRIVAASEDGKARVWNVQTGGLVTELAKHGGPVRSAQFSPDSKRIVTASDDRTARVWDAQSGRPLAEALKHDDIVESAQFSRDGTRVGSASWDKTARVWDAETGRLLSTLKHADKVLSVRFSPDGRRIVTASSDGKARVSDAQSGQFLAELPEDGGVISTQFSPDGNGVSAITWDGRTCAWDAQRGQQLTKPKQRMWLDSARFSPEGGRIAVVSWDTVRVLDAQNGELLTEALRHAARVSVAEFSPDGGRILTLSDDRSVHIWTTQPGSLRTESMKHRGDVWSAQFSPDGKQIVTASQDETARVWDAQTGQQITPPLKHEGRVGSARFSPDGRRIVTASGDKTARIWDSQTGRQLTPPLKHEGEVGSAQFSPDGRVVLTASRDKTARLWDARTGEPLAKPLEHEDDVCTAQFSPDGKRIVTGPWGWGAKGRIWDSQSSRRLTELLKFGDGVRTAQFSPDGKRIVTAWWDSARVWDAQSGQPLVEPMKHHSWLNAAKFSPDGWRILTASDDRTARVWDAQTGQPLTESLKHEDRVWTAEFSPDGSRVATGSDDSTVRIWDAQTGQLLTEPLKHGWCAGVGQFSPDGSRVVTASRDGTARVWDLAPAQGKWPGWLLRLAEAISGQVLNKQGVLEPTKLNRAEVMDQLRRKLNQAADDDDWVVWGRWFLGDRSARTISSFSKITIPEYIVNRIKENTAESLVEAGNLAVGNQELLGLLARVRALPDQIGQANALRDQRKFAEAEAKYREALAFGFKFWTNNPAQLEPSVFGLAEMFQRQGKPEEAERLFSEVLTPANESQPQSVGLLRWRGDFRVRHGRWTEAASDYAKVVALDPSDHWNYLLLAPLLAQAGDYSGYDKHWEATLVRFESTGDPVIAERAAKILCLLPTAHLDLERASKLAEMGVSADANDPWRQNTKGMAEYRQGRFGNAMGWAQRVLNKAGESPDREAQAQFVLAMALHQLGRIEEARAALARGTEIVQAKLPRLDSPDVGDGWRELLMAHTWMREAKWFIEGGGAVRESGPDALAPGNAELLRRFSEERARFEEIKQTQKLVCPLTWSFTRGDGSLIARSITLSPDGKILGHSNPGEARWGVGNGVVVFYNAKNEPSCQFTNVSYENGKMRMSGAFLLGGSATHVLTEGPPAQVEQSKVVRRVPPFRPSTRTLQLPEAPRLMGILNLSGTNLALLEVSAPGRARSELALTAGQRNGDVEVLEIDEAAGNVKLKNSGKVSDLTLDADGEAGTLVEPSSGGEKAGQLKEPVRFRLQKAGPPQILHLYQEVAGRSLLRPERLPDFQLSLRSKDIVTAADFLKGVERALAEKGIIIRPDGEKFAIAAAQDADFQKITPQARQLTERLGKSHGKSSTEAPEELLPAGIIDFRAVDLNQALAIYQELTGRTVLWAPPLPCSTMILRTQTTLTRSEVIYAFNAVLALNDISVLAEGEKFLLVVPTTQANKAAALLARQSPARVAGDKGPLPPGALDFRTPELSAVAAVYRDLCGCAIELDAGLPQAFFLLKSQNALTPGEATHALDLLLGLHGLTVVQQEDGKTLKIVRSAEARAKQP